MSLQYLNNFRGIAILLIIFGHALSALPNSQSSVSLLLPVFSNGTLLFVLIAGQFFAALSANFTYKNFIKNKFLFVVLPYLILSLPAALIYLLGLKQSHEWMDMQWFSQLHPLIAYGYLLITGAHLGPLWFVPMIMLYYIFSPLWIAILNRRWILPVFAISFLVALYLGRPVVNANSLQAAFYFLPAYILGIYLGNGSRLIEFLRPYAVTGFILSIIVLILFGQSGYFNSRWDLVLKLVATCFLIALCLEKLNFKIKWLDLFARLSFYLFFVHGYIIGAFRMFLRDTDFHYMSIVAVIGIFAVTLIMCLIAYIFLKWILQHRSKFVLGA